MNTENAVSLVQRLRDIDPEMQIQQLLVLLLVSKNPGRSVGEIAKLAGMTTSSASRAVAYWSPIGRKGKPGHGMIDVKLDPMDHRRKILFLTPKGKRLINDLKRDGGCHDC